MNRKVTLAFTSAGLISLMQSERFLIRIVLSGRILGIAMGKIAISLWAWLIIAFL